MGDDRPRVLLVDDERLVRQIYSDYLVAEGYEVETAESAQSALKLLEPGRYEVVVCDLVLPDGDGLAVLDRAKRVDPDCDVVMITGLERVEPAVRALRAGASDYLVKPVSRDALAHALRRCLSLRRVLRENETLRAGYALLESARLIATAQDRDTVVESLLGSLAQVVGARASLYLSPTNGGWSATRTLGLDGEARQVLVEALASGPLSTPLTTIALVDSLEGAASVTEISALCATLVPIVCQERTVGVVTLFSDGLPAPRMLASIDLLTSAAAQAFSALDRRDEVERLVWTDDLTRLHNARYLSHVLERETGDQGHGRFAVLFIDLDHFKQVNDTHGHLVGSRVLVEAAKVIRAAVREPDVCTRYGGDEFCVVLINADTALAMQVAERIRQSLEQHVVTLGSGAEVAVTASIGVAVFPDHATDARTLLDMADRALYRAKNGPRNITYLAAHAA